MVFDVIAIMIFEFAIMALSTWSSSPPSPGNSTPVAEEIRPRSPKKFDPGRRRNSTPASKEIRPRRPKRFDLGI
jgi:hypothetical protein